MGSASSGFMKKTKSGGIRNKPNVEARSEQISFNERTTSKRITHEERSAFVRMMSNLLGKNSPHEFKDPLKMAKAIDWDQNANKFLTNQISDLSSDEQEFIRRLAENSIVREIAEDLNEARPVVALAFIAKLVEEDDYGAKRFAQRILGNLSEDRLKHAMSCVQTENASAIIHH